MKKIGIVTQYGNTNYGNRLQNYAVQTILEKEGYYAETIVCCKNKNKEFLKKCRNVLGWLLHKPQSVRRHRFDNYNKKCIKTNFVFSTSGLIGESEAQKYDFLITGSDQVWNPETRLNEKDNFLLRFCQRDQRIAIAPSMGVVSFPPSCQTEFKIGFQGFPYLSCREKDGADAISTLAEKECETIIDPTLVLQENEWMRVAKKINVPERYVVAFFLGDIRESTNNIIKDYARKQNLIIIEPNNPNDSYYKSDPFEFLWIIKHAHIIFTDSFHVTAFSLNFHVPFYVFERKQKQSVSERMMSRLTSLLTTVRMEDRIFTDGTQITSVDSFSEADCILEIERKKFIDYLHKCLNQKLQAPFNLPDKKCTGCGICSLKCPKKCIGMKLDAEGFLRPTVDINQCINCGTCTVVCPSLGEQTSDNKKIELYAAHNNDKTVIEHSSSGAVFPEIAKKVVEMGGVVYGAAYNELFSVEHIRIDNTSGISKLLGSKYVQSESYPVFPLIKRDLDNCRRVLFVGTPCQVSSLRIYLGKEYEGLYLIDFVCHGVPSPDYWQKYLNCIQKRFLDNERITGVNFRYKGDFEGTKLKIESKNHEYIKDAAQDPFYTAFSKNLSLRPSCYNCNYKGTARASDITLGDCWGIEKIDPESFNASGTSLVMTQSEKGKQLFESISDRIAYKQIENHKYIGKYNLAMLISVKPHDNRRQFFNTLSIKDAYETTLLFSKEKKMGVEGRILRKVKRMIMNK